MQTLWLQTGSPMKTRIALFITAFLATACSSVEMIDGAATAPLADTCNVSIYQTRRQAEKLGQIEEVCIVNGTSSGSFSHQFKLLSQNINQKSANAGRTKPISNRGEKADLRLPLLPSSDFE